MSQVSELETAAAEVAHAIASLALEHGFDVAVAESLTGGQISTQFAAAPDSSDWFVGGVVTYETRSKHEVLGVSPGPVISESAAREMASGVAHLMGADAAVAATGAGGPGEQEGNPPGTTWIAALVRGTMRTQLHHFSGEPEEILGQTQLRALTLLHGLMADACE